MLAAGRDRWLQLSLSLRLSIWNAAVLAILLVPLGWAIVFAVGRQIEFAVDVIQRAETERVRQIVGLTTASGTPFERAAAAAVTQPERPPDVWVVVRDGEGRVVARSPGANPLADASGAPGVAAARAGASWWQATTEVPGIGALAVSVAPLNALDAGPSGPVLGTTGAPPAGTPGGFVQVALSTDRAAFVVRAMTIVLTVAFGATVLLALAGGPPVARLGLRPLRALARASARLAGGDLAARVPVPPSRDEVGELARAFNDMAARLEAAFSAQRAFVADASHELRTPLTALGGRLDILTRALDRDPDEARRQMTAMRQDVARMTRLVGDLLQLARLDANGRDDLRLADVDLAAVARDVYEQSRALPAVGDRDLRLVDGAPVPLQGDASRLHQVLLNLVANALQQSPPGGHVDLVVRAVPGAIGRPAGAEAIVQDDGPGVAPEHLPHLFDRFYRTDTSRARSDGGTGLGLAIARAIVEAHGGTLRTENVTQSGARFTVTLPAVPPPGSGDATSGRLPDGRG